MGASIGARIRAAREAANYTQEEFAALVGQNQQHVSKWENDRFVPSTDSLVAISNHTGKSIDWLLGLVDTPSERVEKSDLSPMERRLLRALREGEITEALETFTALTKGNK